MPQYPVIQDRKAAPVLIGDHAGQLWLCDNLILQTDVFNVVCGVGIACGPNYAAVVFEGEFVLQIFSQRALKEWHVALRQLEIKRDVAATASSLFPASALCFGYQTYQCLGTGHFSSPGLSSRDRCNSGRFAVIDGHNLIAVDFHYSLFHNGAAQVLNHCPVCIFTIQRDSEGEAGSPWDDDVVCAEVGEPNNQLLVLVNRAQVIGYHDGLPHTFDPLGLAEAPVTDQLSGHINQIHETIRRLLHEDKTLAERFRTLFCEQGITIVSILTAIGMGISTLVLALTGGGAGGTPSPVHRPPNKGGVREWVKKHLQALGHALANFSSSWLVAAARPDACCC